MFQLRLSQGISSGCHMPPYTHFYGIVIIAGMGHYALIRLSQGIYSAFHSATLTPCFKIVIIVGRVPYHSALT